MSHKKGTLDHEACRHLYFVMEHRESLWDTQKKLLIVLHLVPWALTKTHIWWQQYRWRWRWSSMWANGEYEQRCRCVRSPNCHFYGDAPQLCYWISGGHRFSDNALDGEDDHDHRCCEFTLHSRSSRSVVGLSFTYTKHQRAALNSITTFFYQTVPQFRLEMMMTGWLWIVKKFMNVNAWAQNPK